MDTVKTSFLKRSFAKQQEISNPYTVDVTPAIIVESSARREAEPEANEVIDLGPYEIKQPAKKTGKKKTKKGNTRILEVIREGTSENKQDS